MALLAITRKLRVRLVEFAWCVNLGRALLAGGGQLSCLQIGDSYGGDYGAVARALRWETSVWKSVNGGEAVVLQHTHSLRELLQRLYRSGLVGAGEW